MTEVGIMKMTGTKLCLDRATSIRDMTANMVFLWPSGKTLEPEKHRYVCTDISEDHYAVKIYISNRGNVYITLYDLRTWESRQIRSIEDVPKDIPEPVRKIIIDWLTVNEG